MIQNDSQCRIRIPKELKNWIEKQAKENKRSLNSQIVYCIERIKKATDTDQSNPAAFYETNIPKE
ncbi:hypothetical protein COMNV_00445 [Commensalibacter sp. Nvir]|uniref:Arc family DNA-binding protein n=1 Tax=Commensalibacter sp. Nvir TaxID=3069817 RepID=UPI002D735CF8|nr:hypothetical protein COMNV_00445 [Commensalibacter sp. Nvir]